VTYDESTFPALPQSWATISVAEAHQLVAVEDKVQVRHYSEHGPLAIVDQGAALIGGYTDDRSLAMRADLPVIVFGDHTRALKYVDFPFAAGADGIKVMRPRPFFFPRLFFRFLQAVRLPARGYSRHFQYLQAARLAVPPLNEQKLIADKLDAVLARVDACDERLDRVPDILKRFRQAVLTAATSGRLTAGWQGPEGRPQWRTETLADLCHSISDGDHQAPPQARSGVPFITISAINNGRLRLEKATRYVPVSYFEALRPERRPQKGDVLFSVTGSIGIPALVDVSERFAFQRHIAILKPNQSRVMSRFLYITLNTERIRQQGLTVATGTAQLTIPLGGLRSFVVDVPSLPEQAEIVRRVDALFAHSARVEGRHASAHAQVARLTSALLAKAFRGELVPQDPNDEPGSVLLERLRTAQAAEVRSGRRYPSTEAGMRTGRARRAAVS
jgi:hypothetical protein